MSNQRVYLDDIYASKACEGSTFRAVVMMAHEARFINEQARLGYLQLKMKPTTIAMEKFKDDKLSLLSKEEAEAREAAKASADAAQENSETPASGASANATDAANDAFGV